MKSGKHSNNFICKGQMKFLNCFLHECSSELSHISVGVVSCFCIVTVCLILALRCERPLGLCDSDI